MNDIQSNLSTAGVRAVILDWAGTAIDYGCVGPTAVFLEAFARFDIVATAAQARRFMGLEKKDHIRAMLGLPELAAQWRGLHGREPSEEDVSLVYAATEPLMIKAVADHCGLIDGLLEFVAAMRGQGIKIGSSTGYTARMMEVVVPRAAAQGYSPDAVVCSSDVPAGRPHPYMCYENALRLQVYPLAAMVKIGDTLSDIEEGLNAGMWTVGLTRCSNELGLTREETEALAPDDLRARLDAIEDEYRRLGVHYVAAGIWECRPIIADINRRLLAGARPEDRRR
jgi:phosphonoacetaldehyde hydrolase